MVKLGIVGIYRGKSFYENAKFCEIVAICDKNVETLEKVKKEMNTDKVTFYTDFDEFLKHDMDGVVLANYATEHAPFAIKALKAGKHVLSEVLPCECMAQAVELVETVEETGKIYAYAENYCFMPAPREMRKIYRSGKLGNFEYGEGEYIHNVDMDWPQLAYGDPNHWRNNVPSTFYCTHSLGPLIHITGLRPVQVVGYEIPPAERTKKIGRKGGTAGIEMVKLENGAVIKSVHGELIKYSVWYAIYGSLGRIESTRDEAGFGGINAMYSYVMAKEGDYENTKVDFIKPEATEEEKAAGHGGSDFYTVNNFARKIAGEDVDIIDIYEALDMGMPGILAHYSYMHGNIPVDIPNLRLKEERDKYRNDYTCTNVVIAGSQFLAPSMDNEPISEEVYAEQKRLHQEFLDKERNKEKEGK